MAMTKSDRETADGHDQEREKQSMVMTRREKDSRWSWQPKREQMLMTKG